MGAVNFLLWLVYSQVSQKRRGPGDPQKAPLNDDDGEQSRRPDKPRVAGQPRAAVPTGFVALLIYLPRFTFGQRSAQEVNFLPLQMKTSICFSSAYGLSADVPT